MLDQGRGWESCVIILIPSQLCNRLNGSRLCWTHCYWIKSEEVCLKKIMACCDRKQDAAGDGMHPLRLASLGGVGYFWWAGPGTLFCRYLDRLLEMQTRLERVQDVHPSFGHSVQSSFRLQQAPPPGLIDRHLETFARVRRHCIKPNQKWLHCDHANFRVEMLQWRSQNMPFV